MNNIIGCENEIKELLDRYHSNTAQFVSVYLFKI